MSLRPKTDIGSHISAVVGVTPKAETGGAAILSSAIDRTSFANSASCVVVARSGAATGSPTSFTYAVELQDCDTSGGTYATFGTALTTITASNTTVEKSFDLTSARRFLKVSRDVDFVGGSSPTLPAAEFCILGGGDNLAQ